MRLFFVVYGFELLVRMWLVSLVLDFVVACFFGCVSSPILVVEHTNKTMNTIRMLDNHHYMVPIVYDSL